MKNTIKLKAMLRIAGIIALAAVIGFSFTACGGDDDKGGGGPVTLSLNKVDGNKFTMTVSGATWKTSAPYSFSAFLNFDGGNGIFDPGVRTSNTVVTFTKDASDTYTGTVTFTSTSYVNNSESTAWWFLDGVGKDPHKEISVNSAKSSITFP